MSLGTLAKCGTGECECAQEKCQGGSTTPPPVPTPESPSVELASWTDAKTAIEAIASGSSAAFTLAANFDCNCGNETHNDQIKVVGHVTIHGNGAVLDGSQMKKTWRSFDEKGGFFSVNANAQLHLDSMTLQNSDTTGTSEGMADSLGGAINVRGGILSILRCIFQNNAGDMAGAIDVGDPRPSRDDSGAVQLVVDKSTFRYNRAVLNGCGIRGQWDDRKVCKIPGEPCVGTESTCSSFGTGGAISLFNHITATITTPNPATG